MGPAISYLFYFLYILFTIIGLVAYPLRRYRLFFLMFCFLLHVNVTSFSNIGIAWTGDFVLSIEIILFEFIQYLKRPWQLQYRVFDHQKIWLLFFALCCFSVVNVCFRTAILGFPFGLDPIARSIKSLMRYAIVFSSFFVLANTIARSRQLDMRSIAMCISISSLFPMFFAFYQTIGSRFPMFLIQNNNTFTKEAYAVFYQGQRAVGLSAESSFFAYLVSFSLIATIWLLIYSTNWRHRIGYFILMAIQFTALAFSVSRTGLVLSILAAIYLLWKRSLKILIGFAAFAILLLFMVNSISIAAHTEFSLFERLSSVGNTTDDLSNVERYGVTFALGKMLTEPEALLGYGFFNYMYYLNDFLPWFMKNMLESRYTGVFLPSFNLILQLVVEVGIIPSLIFITYCFSLRSLPKGENNSRAKQNEVFHKSLVFLIIIGALTFNVLTFSFSFIPVLICSKVYDEQ